MNHEAVTADPLDAVSVVLPQGISLAELFARTPAPPFAPDALSFMESFSRRLLRDPAVRQYPELVALGFWARAASIKRLNTRFAEAYPEAVRLARGLAFHVAPSNVDTIFVYSLLLSLLAGNVNVIRVSSRGGDQADALMRVLSGALEEAEDSVRARIAIIRYAHDRAVTDALCARCHIRVVWGGDATVSTIRQSPLAPAGTELVFANKYSVSVIDAAAWLAADEKAAVAKDFVNDSLWFGQAACSSPRAVIWRGDEEATNAASASFWAEVRGAALAANFPLEGADAVAKLLAEQTAAIEVGAQVVSGSADNHVRVIRPPLSRLGGAPLASAGFFEDYRIEGLADLLPHIAENWQTVTSFGIAREDWAAFLGQHQPRGIARIVKPGHALNFDSLWDGVDLLTQMTRLVVIE